MTAIPSAKAPNFDAFSVSCTAGPSVSINLHKGNLLQFWEGKTEVIDAQHGFYGVGMSIRHAELVLESSMSDSIRDEGSSVSFSEAEGKVSLPVSSENHNYSTLLTDFLVNPEHAFAFNPLRQGQGFQKGDRPKHTVLAL